MWELMSMWNSRKLTRVSLTQSELLASRRKSSGSRATLAGVRWWRLAGWGWRGRRKLCHLPSSIVTGHDDDGKEEKQKDVDGGGGGFLKHHKSETQPQPTQPHNNPLKKLEPNPSLPAGCYPTKKMKLLLRYFKWINISKVDGGAPTIMGPSIRVSF